MGSVSSEDYKKSSQNSANRWGSSNPFNEEENYVKEPVPEFKKQVEDPYKKEKEATANSLF